MSGKNLSFSLIETDNNTDIVTYEGLLEQVNEESKHKLDCMQDFSMDDILAQELDYKENYTKKQLDRIADYYQIPKRKKKKNELIEEIVIFENDPENLEISERRKILWFYIEEIKSDNYLSKFLILD